MSVSIAVYSELIAAETVCLLVDLFGVFDLLSPECSSIKGLLHLFSFYTF